MIYQVVDHMYIAMNKNKKEFPMISKLYNNMYELFIHSGIWNMPEYIYLMAIIVIEKVI